LAVFLAVQYSTAVQDPGTVQVLYQEQYRPRPDLVQSTIHQLTPVYLTWARCATANLAVEIIQKICQR